MSRETDEVLEHDYDGIREYDNPLPGWWVSLFYVSIVFAVAYLPYYTLMGGPSQEDEYRAEMEVAAAARPEKKEVTRDELAAIAKDSGRVAEGKVTFGKYCAACHKLDGGGLVGPNLTDAYWKHGPTMADHIKVVTEGVKGTAMVAWNKQLSAGQIESVVAYVASLQGTSPPGAKAPEGKLYEAAE